MNTDMTTKFTNHCSWQFTKALKLECKRETTHYYRSMNPNPLQNIKYPPIGGHHIPHVTSLKPTDKDHDKYQHGHLL